MEVSESETLLSDLVDIWSADFTTKAAHIRESQVVGDNDEEIGAFSCHCQESAGDVGARKNEETCEGLHEGHMRTYIGNSLRDPCEIRKTSIRPRKQSGTSSAIGSKNAGRAPHLIAQATRPIYSPCQSNKLREKSGIPSIFVDDSRTRAERERYRVQVVSQAWILGKVAVGNRISMT